MASTKGAEGTVALASARRASARVGARGSGGWQRPRCSRKHGGRDALDGGRVAVGKGRVLVSMARPAAPASRSRFGSKRRPAWRWQQALACFTRRPRSMSRPQAGRWKAPGVSTYTCVEGGYLKAPRAVPCEVFAWPDGKEESFTPVSKSEAWLAEAVAAKHVTSRCLKRSAVFQHLREAMRTGAGLPEEAALLRSASRGAPAAAGLDARLAALSYGEDPEDPILATPAPKRRKSRAKLAEVAHVASSPEKTQRAKGTDGPLVVRMKPTASAGAGQLVNVTVVARGTKLLLAVSSVPWLIKYLAQELEDGGVAVEEEASAVADEAAAAASPGTIFWDFRDSAWVARAKRPSGTGEGYVSRRVAIARRMLTPGDSLYGLTRTDAKAVAFEELRLWREAVSEGQLAPEDAAADVASFRV